jgi:hypothetical protein
MQIVIEIDEEKYSYVKGQVEKGIDNPLKVIIANGTPLPKWHGDLIDRNSILCDDCSCEQCGHTDECFKLLAPTIIEANGGNENADSN